MEKVIWYLFFLPIPSLLRDGMLKSPAHWRMAIVGKKYCHTSVPLLMLVFLPGMPLPLLGGVRGGGRLGERGS